MAPRGSNKKARRPRSGFDIVADILDKIFFSLMQSPPVAANDNINVAFRALKSTFTAPRNGMANAPTPSPSPVAATPVSRSTSSATLSTVSTRSMSGSLPTPTMLSLTSTVDASADALPNKLLDASEGFVAVSSQNHGVRRLRIGEVLRLMENDELIIVIPPSDYKQPKDARAPRNAVREGIRRIVRRTAPPITPAGKDEFVDAVFRRHAILRDGKSFHEFSARVAAYPERHKLDQQNPLPIDIRHMLGVGNAGLYLELNSIGSNKPYLLRLNQLPFVEV